MLVFCLTLTTNISFAQSLVDLSMTELLTPSDGCVLGAHENVSVRISNPGAVDVTSVTLFYRLDSGTVYSEVLNDTIFAGQTYDYTFTNSSHDFSVAGDYFVEYWLSLPSDIVSSNDSSSATASLAGDLPITMTMTTASYGYEVSWNIEDANGNIVLQSQGSLSSYTTYTDNICLNTCQTYTMNMIDSYGDGWNGGTYSITTPNEVDTLPAVVLSSGGLTGGSSDSDDFSLCNSADIALNSIEHPTNGCILTSSESVSIQLSNTGGDTLFTWDVNYSLNGGATITETVNDTLAPSTTYSYTFTTSEDLSAGGSYDILAWVTIANDVQSANDSLSSTVNLEGDLPITVNMNTSSYGYEVSWNIEDANGNIVLQSQGSLSSNTSYTDNTCLNTCQTYTFNMIDSYGDGWNGGTYSVTTPDSLDSLPAIVLSSGGLTSGFSDSDDFSHCQGSDLSITQILLESGCALSDTEYVSIEISNNASDTIFGFDISYSLDSATVVTESSTDTLVPGQILTYTFSSTTEDLSVFGNHSITAWVHINNDLNTSNDTVTNNFNISGDFEITITTNTSSYGAEVSWNLTNSNGDVILNSPSFSSNSNYTSDLCIASCEVYTFNLYDSFGDGWNGGTYSIDAPNPNSDTLPDINLSSGGLASGSSDSDEIIYCDGIDMSLISTSLSHSNGCLQTDTSNISFTINNSGADTIFSLDVSYILNGASTVTETINDTIAPGDNYIYTFSAVEDLSAEGSYSFSAWISTIGDLVNNNDTINQEVGLSGTLPIVVSNYVQYWWTGVAWQLVGQISGDTIMTSTTFGSSFTTYYSDEFCVNTCENYLFEMYDNNGGWASSEYYTILSPTGIDSIPYNTLQTGTLESGTYGYDPFSYCDGWDATLQEILLESGCLLSDTHQISLRVENSGADTIFSLDLSYAIDSQAVVTESWNDTLLPGATMDYSFNTTEDLSVSGQYSVQAWVNSSLDLNNYNDSNSVNFNLNGDFPIDLNLYTGSFPSEISFELVSSTNDTVYVSPPYSGTYITTTTSTCLNTCENYTVHMHDSWGDGWNNGSLTITSTAVDTSLSNTIFSGTVTFTSGNYEQGNLLYCTASDISVLNSNLQSGCIYSNETEVVLEVQNLSILDTIQDFVVVYYVDSNTIYTDSVSLEILPADQASVTLSNTFDLSMIGDYVFNTNIILSDDYDITNNVLTDSISLIANMVPNYQSFDSLSVGVLDDFDNGAWMSNSTDTTAYSWRTNSGSTPTYPYTGPSSGNGGAGVYLYVEQDNGIVGNIASITSRCYDLNNTVNPKLGFWYHKSGADQGNLIVKAQGDTTITLGTISGQTQIPGNNPWLFQQYDLDMFIGQSIVLIFEAQKTASGSNGDICIDNINVVDLPLIVIADTTACSVDSVLVSAPDGWSTYTWQSSDSTQLFADSTQSVFITINSDIILTAYDSLSFYETDTFNVFFEQNLESVSGIDTTICLGQYVELSYNVGNASTYDWNTGDSTNNITVNPTQDTDYILTVSNSCDSYFITSKVSVNNPSVSISPSDTSICQGDTIMLSATDGFVSYTWSGSGGTIGNLQTIEVSTGGYYSVLVADSIGCNATAQTVQITLLDSTQSPCTTINVSEFEIGSVMVYPNPNNGLFTIEIDDTKQKVLSIEILDPLGKQVYQKQFNKVNNRIIENIDLSQLSQGIYMMNINTEEETLTKRITIQK